MKKQCKLPDVKLPKRVAYSRFLDFAWSAYQAVRKLFRRTRGTKDEPLPPPHQWPPYGGTCWQAAYQEAIAMRLVAETYQAYQTALKSWYMPAEIIAKYLAAYNAAKIQYLAAWGAMEDCLVTTV